jgi:hypothetical protein
MIGNKINIFNNKGVSLLEIVVALGIFLIVILAVVSFFEISIMNQRGAINAGNIQESMRYAFEAMSKEIRMAVEDELGSCVGAGKIYQVGSNNLKFINQYDECVEYYLENSRIKIKRGAVEGWVTSENIKADELAFYLDEVTQPRVTILANLSIPVKSGISREMILQTTVSSRYYK